MDRSVVWCDLRFVIYISMSPSLPWYFYTSDKRSDKSWWCPQLPSKRTDKSLPARFRVLFWSLSVGAISAKIFPFLLWTGIAPQCFTVEREITTPPSIFLRKPVNAPQIGLEDGYKNRRMDNWLTKSVFMRKPGTSRQGVIMLKSTISLKLGTNVRHRQLTYMVKDQVKMLNSQPSCLLYG